MRYLDSPTKAKSTSSRYWDSTPVDFLAISAINTQKVKAVQSPPKNDIFEALAAIPGIQSLATKSPVQPKSEGVKMTVDCDQISEKLVSKMMFALGYSNEVYINPDLQSALVEAYDLNYAHRLGLMHDINRLKKDFEVQIFPVDGFSAQMKSLLGFGGGSFATKVNGMPTIVLDLNECCEIGSSINRIAASVAKCALLHELGHLEAQRLGQSIQNESLAWALGLESAGWLLHGGDHDITMQKVQRHLALQQAA